jgi:small multidrug resistance pump
MKNLYPIAWAVGLSMLSVIADYCLKRASDSEQAFQSPYFGAGAAILAISSYGWVHVLRHMKLASLGAIYSVVTVIALVLVELSIFKGSFTKAEWIGLSIAISSLIPVSYTHLTLPTKLL